MIKKFKEETIKYINQHPFRYTFKIILLTIMSVKGIDFMVFLGIVFSMMIIESIVDYRAYKNKIG